MEKQSATYYFFSLACGMVDAICFAGLGGVFVSLMTGNIILLGIAIGQRHAVDAFFPFLIPLMFYGLGTLLGGWLTATYTGVRVRKGGFCAVWLLVLLAVSMTLHLQLLAWDLRFFCLLATLGLASGLQSALLQRAGLKNFASNVMTSTLTSLLVDVGAKGEQPREVFAGRLLSILFFLVGAILGAAALQLGLTIALLLTLIPLTVAVVGALREVDPV